MYKLLLVIGLCVTASVGRAEVSKFNFPRNVECGPSAEVMEAISKYEERIIFTGSSMNTAEDHRPEMMVTANVTTGTYTFFNYYRESDFLCLIDSGKLKVYREKPPKKVEISL